MIIQTKRIYIILIILVKVPPQLDNVLIIAVIMEKVNRIVLAAAQRDVILSENILPNVDKCTITELSGNRDNITHNTETQPSEMVPKEIKLMLIKMPWILINVIQNAALILAYKDVSTAALSDAELLEEIPSSVKPDSSMKPVIETTLSPTKLITWTTLDSQINPTILPWDLKDGEISHTICKITPDSTIKVDNTITTLKTQLNRNFQFIPMVPLVTNNALNFAALETRPKINADHVVVLVAELSVNTPENVFNSMRNNRKWDLDHASTSAAAKAKVW